MKNDFWSFAIWNTTKESDLQNENQTISVKCKYVTNVQLNQMLSNQK